jgi:hypothetical protein
MTVTLRGDPRYTPPWTSAVTNSIASTAIWIYDARNIRLFCLRESSASQSATCLPSAMTIWR